MTDEMVSKSHLIDFIARTESPDIWRIVLVEQGPWPDSEQKFYALQDRLYNCIDGVLDGKIATKFPETHGKTILIQLDAYDLQDTDIEEFFDRFSLQLMNITDYSEALSDSEYVKSFKFKLNMLTI